MYAFLELQKCDKLQDSELSYYHPLQKSISYNVPELNPENYKKSIADFSVSGVSRQRSMGFTSGSLSGEDYKRITELKNQRKTETSVEYASKT